MMRKMMLLMVVVAKDVAMELSCRHFGAHWMLAGNLVLPDDADAPVGEPGAFRAFASCRRQPVEIVNKYRRVLECGIHILYYCLL